MRHADVGNRSHGLVRFFPTEWRAKQAGYVQVDVDVENDDMTLLSIWHLSAIYVGTAAPVLDSVIVATATVL